MEARYDMLKFEGYLGINLDGFKVGLCNNFKLFSQKNGHLLSKKDVNKSYDELEILSYEELKKLSDTIFKELFGEIQINHIPDNKIDWSFMKSVNDLIDDPIAFYDKANSASELISIYDLPIVLIPKEMMTGYVKKPIVFLPGGKREDNSKIFFSLINIPTTLNKVTACTLVHEYTHVAQERNFGYATDLLDREVLPILLEKIAALKIDPTGNVLKIVEKRRILDMLDKYIELSFCNKKLSKQDEETSLMYLKSSLIATKLFDIYVNLRKPKDKDLFIDDINKVFDGKQTVEEYIKQKKITIAQCQDLNMLKRHI